jgi:chromosome segregation ATPase
MNTQKEAVSNERLAIVNEKKQLQLDRETLDADRRQLDARKTGLAQSETDLQLKRRELDNDRQQFEHDRTRITVDGDKLVKDREKWVEEVERMNVEKQQVAAEKEAIRVERERLEQDKRLFASTPGAPALPKPKKPLDAASSKQNLKQLTEMFEGMSPEVAAGTIKELSVNGETDMVVDVLVQLEQRKASAILDAIADERLVSEFLVKINSRNSQPKAAKN